MKKSFVRSVARIAALGTVLAAAQLMAPAGNAAPVVAADKYPNSVATVTNLTLTRNVAQYGDRTRATVTVKPAGSAAGTPPGRVTLRISGVSVESSSLSGGRASFSLPRRLSAGKTYRLRASYTAPGKSMYRNSGDSAFYTVNKGNTSASGRASRIRRGERPLVRADVTSAAGLTPNGRVRVSLSKNGNVKQSKTVSLQNGGRRVSFNSVGPRGRWSANVAYLGTSNFQRDSGGSFRVES